MAKQHTGGLPHAHIVYRLKDGLSKKLEDLESIFCARMPNETEPEHREAVQKFMIHKCKGKNCINPETHKCEDHFPKPLSPTTYLDERGFVVWKRLEAEDQHVSTHIPYLLIKYQCHIHVSIAELYFT